jgi:hypothetical protein
MIIYRCDGCSKTEESPSGVKPRLWFARTIQPKDKSANAYGKTEKHACSRTCVDKIDDVPIIPI